jgi:hypothetical protein
MIYPRPCPVCGVLTDEDGFPRDRTQPSGRKSRCKRCHSAAAGTYYHDVRRPRLQAAFEAERRAEETIRQREHKKRLRAVHREAEAGRRRQAALFREIGVADPSPEEVARKPGATPID